MPPNQRTGRSDLHDAVAVALGADLHRAYDHILHEPIPKELLVASGQGPAKWDALRTEWGAADERKG